MNVNFLATPARAHRREMCEGQRSLACSEMAAAANWSHGLQLHSLWIIPTLTPQSQMVEGVKAQVS